MRAQIIRATRREIATFHAARRRKRSGTRMTYAFKPMLACNYGFIENDASPRCFVLTPGTSPPAPSPSSFLGTAAGWSTRENSRR